MAPINPINYVTYDDAGTLTGSYFQPLQAAHTSYIEVTEAERKSWVLYRANEARDGVELKPEPSYDLAGNKTALIKQIDADVDAIYDETIGSRSDEYNQANADATAFAAGNYEGDVPNSVQAWANAKGWTAQVATDDILATAALWITARDAMRTNRLAKKEAARVAVSKEELLAVANGWAAFRTFIRSQLGI